MSEEIELEKRLAILAACVTLLNMKRRLPRIEAGTRGAAISGWSIAARLDPPSEVWCTREWGRHEEEV